MTPSVVSSPPPVAGPAGTVTARVVPDLEVWAGTHVGDTADWPPALQTAARICLAWPTPCCVLWGDRSRIVYNDPMAATMGALHPTSLGQPLYEVLPALWQWVGPLVSEVMRTGRSFAASRFPLQADIGQGPRTHFLTFTMAPVWEGADVVGVFCPVAEETAEHLAAQHREILAVVATIPGGQTQGEVASAITRALVEADDVRFAAVFLAGDDGRPVRLASSGVPLRTGSALAAVDVAVAAGHWPVTDLLTGRGPAVVRASPRPAVGPAPRPSWEAAWLVALPASSGLRGALVVGLDERVFGHGPPEAYLTALAGAAAERLAR